MLARLIDTGQSLVTSANQVTIKCILDKAPPILQEQEARGKEGSIGDRKKKKEKKNRHRGISGSLFLASESAKLPLAWKKGFLSSRSVTLYGPVNATTMERSVRTAARKAGSSDCCLIVHRHCCDHSDTDVN